MLDVPTHKIDQPSTVLAPIVRGPLKLAVSAQGLLRPAGSALWRWRYRAPAILAALVAAWYFGTPMALGPIVDADAVVRADFVQSVVASGHVEAPFRVNVASRVTGTVAEIPVAEGQTVKAGDTLVKLDDTEARAAVAQAQGAVAQAEARVRQLRELTLPSAEQARAQAQATLTNAQKAYDRAARLAATGIATRVTLDDAAKALDIARAQLRSAEFQVFTSRPGGSDYVMAQTQLDQARANLASAQSQLDYTIIKAPRDGILIARNDERADVVQPSNVLMMLSPSGETQLVVQIDEKNLGLIAAGQSALASADAYPKDTFAAQVVYINPGIDLQRASVEVKLSVPKPPAYLRQDMTISVDIKTAEHPHALIAPAASIRGLANGKPWVLKVGSAYAARQPVKIGLASGGKVEILDGLKEGDVVLPASAAVKDGERVRARVDRAPVP